MSFKTTPKDQPENNVNRRAFGGAYTKQEEIKTGSRLEVIPTADDEVYLSEPADPYAATYPYNNVEQSLSGHIREVDDTPGAERIFEMHKSGTYYEVHPDGNKVTKVFGDNFEIVIDDDVIVVGGDRHVVIQGDCMLLVQGDMKQKVKGNYELVVHGDHTTRVSGKTKLFSHDDVLVQTDANLDTYVESDMSTHVKGNEYFKTDGVRNHYVVGTITYQTDGNFLTNSSGDTSIFASGINYIDGSDVHFNLPGPTPAAVDVRTTKQADPGPGLEVPKNIFEPIRTFCKAVTRSIGAALSVKTDSGLADRKPYDEDKEKGA